MELIAYQDGIIRVKMTDSEDSSYRFGITDINVGIEEHKLTQINNIKKYIHEEKGKNIKLKLKS